MSIAWFWLSFDFTGAALESANAASARSTDRVVVASVYAFVFFILGLYWAKRLEDS